jgi:exodeoxyribonuclease VII large subunit
MRPRSDTATTTKEELSLSELAGRIKKAIAGHFPDTYWIRAETSDVRMNASGHCYLELIEKNEHSGQISARIRASIWASTFYKVKYAFEYATGQAFSSGIKILVKVKVEYHEVYGFNINILDIDPTYTIGDLVRKRNDILRRLQEDGVLGMNRELPFPTLPRRIAVISSQTAAGYGDFINQLEGNHAGYVFYHRLFPAVMQGEKTEASIIAALESIFNHVDHFDTVTIIRGGGATSELSCFDSYDLAAHCAQFPLPILTGIGHDRDETVLDFVAFKMLKTPTAVAEYLIACMDAAAEILAGLRQDILSASTDRISKEKKRLQSHAIRLPAIVLNRLDRSKAALSVIEKQLPIKLESRINRERNRLLSAQNSIRMNATKRIADSKHFLQLTEQFIRMASPDYNLKRGYSLTLRNGIIVKRAAALSSGDEITTRFIDGDIDSIIR